MLAGGRKEIFRLNERALGLFDLGRDPAGDPRPHPAPARRSRPLERLRLSMAEVDRGLVASDRLGPAEVDPEQVQALRALGYAE